MGCLCSKPEVGVDDTMCVFDKVMTTVQLSLSEIIEENYNTKIFRLKLPDGHTLGLPVGQHLQLQADIDGESIKRSYTPITLDSTVGYVDLVIKVYFPNDKFPHGGLMSQYVNKLTVGSKINVIGPRGKISYRGNGEFRFRENKDLGEFSKIVKTKNVVMIAGGTGVTPMLQIIRDVCKDATDQTNLWLLFANQTEDDILCRAELEHFEKDSRFSVNYTLDRPNSDWQGKSGF